MNNKLNDEDFLLTDPILSAIVESIRKQIKDSVNNTEEANEKAN